MMHAIDILIEIVMLAPLGAIVGLIGVQWAPFRVGQEK